jgi:hypothetical protein
MCYALSVLVDGTFPFTQGITLGCRVTPRWGFLEGHFSFTFLNSFSFNFRPFVSGSMMKALVGSLEGF